MLLKGKVKRIEFSSQDTSKIMYVNFDRNGNITETNIYASPYGDISTDGSTVISNEYYPNNHIKRRMLLYTKANLVISNDTFVQTGSRSFKMSLTAGKNFELWQDGFDSSASYAILQYDDNGYLKKKENYKQIFLHQKKA